MKNFNSIRKKYNFFFSGICGISMYGIALFIKSLGYDVCGSDANPNPENMSVLENHGIKVFPYHSADNVTGDIFVYSSAVSKSNPERFRAELLGMKAYSRAELLGEITSQYKNRIGVAGTHGKSTVSGMCDKIFFDCGCDISSFIGAKRSEGEAVRIGKGDTVIFEACEYQKSFLNFKPTLGVILNIERDHTDCYPTWESEIDAFKKFAKSSERLLLSFDDKNSKEITHSRPFYFSLDDSNADIYAENIRSEHGCYSYTGVIEGKKAFDVKLSVAGLHNLKNSLAAMGVAYLSGLDIEKSAKAISGFCGMKRRLEYLGTVNGAPIYDDYAHHPTEIKAVLKAVQEMGFDKIYCAFQSHTYSRTAAFFDEFASAFSDADRVFIAEIFSARESNDLGVSGQKLADATPNAEFIGDFDELSKRLVSLASPGAVIITLGAGELNRLFFQSK